MADWGYNQAERVLSGAQNLVGIVTPGVNAKGAEYTCGTLSKPTNGFHVLFSYMQPNTTARTVLIDIMVDGVVVVSNLAICPGGYGGASSLRAHAQTVFVPCRLPSGVVSVKAQCSVSLGACYLDISPVVNGFECGAVVDTYGVDLSTTKGVPVTCSGTDSTWGAWTQITLSSNRVRSLLVKVGHANTWQTAFTDQWHSFEIGVGASGSEAAVLSVMEAGAVVSATGLVHPQFHGPYAVDVPIGTRLSARLMRQRTSTSQRVLDFILYGVR